MRYAGPLLGILIFLFWVWMNSLQVLRQVELGARDRYRTCVTDFLGNDLLRERWLGVYKNNRKVGYTGYVYEKIFAEQDVEIRTTLESRMTVQFLMKDVEIELNGSLLLDGEMRPKQLRLDILVAGKLPLALTGSQEGDKLILLLRQGGTTMGRMSLPRRELFLGDGLAPSLPIAGLRVGDEFEISCFDPLTLGHTAARVRVVSREIREIDGLLAEAFQLETRFREITSTSWVTASGELLRQEFGPPFQDYVLRRETRTNARRFYKK